MDGGAEFGFTVTKMDEGSITVIQTARNQIRFGYPKDKKDLSVNEDLSVSIFTVKLDDASNFNAKATVYELLIKCFRDTSICDQAKTTPLVYKLSSEPWR